MARRTDGRGRDAKARLRRRSTLTRDVFQPAGSRIGDAAALDDRDRDGRCGTRSAGRALQPDARLSANSPAVPEGSFGDPKPDPEALKSLLFRKDTQRALMFPTS